MKKGNIGFILVCMLFLAIIMTSLQIVSAINYVDGTPCNANASTDAKKVLAYLASHSQDSFNGIIAGQNCGHGNEITAMYSQFVDSLYNNTGKYIGMLSVDYEFLKEFSTSELSETNQKLIQFWNSGGLVTIVWSPTNLFSDTGIFLAPWDTYYVNLNDLIDPSTTYYTKWMSKLDRIATALTELRNAGVVVLWRPMQEMNGTWFWWGKTSHLYDYGEAYKRVYRHMYDYFTNTKGLNNLLWAYSPVGGDNWAYPGDNYVDVVAPTGYDNDLTVWEYGWIKQVNKPVGRAEWGPRESDATGGNFDDRKYVNRARSDYQRLCYWVSWHDFGNSKMSIVSNAYASELMNDSGVITRDKINWKSSTPAPEQTPPPTPTPILHNLPGKFKAVEWSNYGGVWKDTCQDTDGGECMGFVDDGDYIDYLVNVPTTGKYTLEYRVSSPGDGGKFRVLSGNTNLGEFDIPNTGDWQNWQTVLASTGIQLSAGQQTIRILFLKGWLNFNWFQFYQGTPPTVSISSPANETTFAVGSNIVLEASASDPDGAIQKVEFYDGTTLLGTVNSSPFRYTITNAARGVYNITAKAYDYQNCFTISSQTNIIVGNTSNLVKIEGENYNDQYGVQKVENDTAVGWFHAQDWIKYSAVDFQAGSSTMDFNVGVTPDFAGGIIEIRIDSITGKLLGSITITNTGGWTNYQVQTAKIYGAKGIHDIYLVGKSGQGICNLDWFQVNGVTVTGGTPPNTTSPTPTSTATPTNFTNGPTNTATKTPTPTITATSTPTSTPTLPPSPGSNIIANPGFESGNNSWNGTGWGSIAGNQHSGANAVRLGTGSGTWCAQDITSGVVAGATYTFSAWSKCDAGQSVNISVQAKNSSGTTIQRFSIPQFTETTYTQKSITFTAPTGTVKFYVECWKNSSGGYIYSDDLSLSTGSVTAPPTNTTTPTATATATPTNRPNTATPTVTPTPTPTTTAGGTNLIANPGFENGNTSWMGTGWGYVAGNQHSGSNSVRLGTGPGTWCAQDVTTNVIAGASYSFSAWNKCDASQTCDISVQAKNSSGATIQRFSLAQFNSTAYNQKTITFIAPTGTVKFVVECWKNSSGGYTYCDDLSLVKN